MSQYLPEECWSLERVPWWEPPYILHQARPEVKLGRSQENNKVVKGYQVSRHHCSFIRSGNPDDWKTVRWSLLDNGSGQGSFVNQTRVERNQPMPLNADDLIGFGCSESSSGRTGGKESFVYRFRAPTAFLSLENDAVDLDIPDSEASTPPSSPLHLPDLVLPHPPAQSSQEPSSSSSSLSLVSLPSTSNKSKSSPTASQTITDLIIIDTSDESQSPKNSPKPTFVDEESSVNSSNKRSLEESSTKSESQNKTKKLKNLFGSDDEEGCENFVANKIKLVKNQVSPKTSPKARMDKVILKSGKETSITKQSNIVKDHSLKSKPNAATVKEQPQKKMQVDDKESQIVKTSKIETNPRKFDTNLLHEEDYTNNFSPISSDEETEAIDLSSKCLEKEPSISPSPSPEKSKGDTKADEKENEDASKSEKEPKRKSFDMLEDLAAKIKAHNEKIQKTSTDESQSIKPLTDEKPMVKLEFPLTEIKSEPTDFITYPNPYHPSNGYSEEPEVITLDDSEDEEAFAQSFKDSSISNPQNEGTESFEPVHDDHEEDSDDEVQIISASETSLFAAISKRIKIEYEDKEQEESIKDDPVNENGDDDDIIKAVVDQVDCDLDSAREGLETAKQMHCTSSPSVEQVVEVIQGTMTSNDALENNNVEESKANDIAKSKEVPKRYSGDSVEDLLGDSDDELIDKYLKNQDSGDEVVSQPIDNEYNDEPMTNDVMNDYGEPAKKSKLQSEPSKSHFSRRKESKSSSNDDNDEPSTSSGSLKPLPTFNKKYKVPKLGKSDDNRHDRRLESDRRHDKKSSDYDRRHARREEDGRRDSRQSDDKRIHRRGPDKDRDRERRPSGESRREERERKSSDESNREERKRRLSGENEKALTGEKKTTSQEEERQDMLSQLKSIKPQQSTSETANMKALRKEKLAAIGKKKIHKDRETKHNDAPVGVLKTSVPRSMQLLNDFAASENLQPKRKVVRTFDLPKLPKPRRAPREPPRESQNSNPPTILSEKPELTIPTTPVNVIKDPSPPIISNESKSKLYSNTDDGYKVPKKMSVSNVVYSIPENQASPRKTGLPTPIPSMVNSPKSILKRKKRTLPRTVRWKDHDGFNELVGIRPITPDNTGKKVTRLNNKDNLVKVNVAKPVNINLSNDNKIINLDDIILKILHWNTAWLEEQKVQAEPPPVHHPWQLIPVTSTFSSWQEYRRIFLPLMLQELWSSISRDYEERKSTGGNSLPICLQEVNLDHGGQFLAVKCLAVMSDHQLRSDICSEGTLTQLDVCFDVVTPDGKRARQIKPCFAFIWSVHRELMRKDDKNLGEHDAIRVKQLQSISNKVHGHGVYQHLVKMILNLKSNLVTPGTQLSVDKPIKMKILSRIKPELRKFTAMLDLPQSRLFESIIGPTSELVSVRNAGTNLHASIQSLSALAMLNQSQKEIIVSVSQACVQQEHMARVCLVQGPPGTGKSSTIAGLILQILATSMSNRNKTMARILVVAPSNAAVDQLALKLISLRSQLQENLQYNMLRLGVTTSMHPVVKEFSFDRMVEKQRQSQTRCNKASDSLEKDIRAKQVAADNLLSDQIRAENAGRMDLAAKLRRDYKDKLYQVEKLRAEVKKPLNNKSRKDIERIAIEKTLAEADIILTTLSSSLTSHMEKYLVQGAATCKSVGPLRPVSVCIMDEASQCVEPEALIPLKFGFCKLVLVGDHEQLPATVTSRKAQMLDYQQSLFSRLVSSMSALSGPSPVLRLDTQYRMQPEIADWPARYFYGGKLSHAAPSPASRQLLPYSVVDVQGETLKTDGAVSNKQEERVVMSCIETIRSMVASEISIGVITFYSKQKQNIIGEVMRRRIVNVAVNTVDGFQGSERDIIIISCVRSGEGSIGFLQDRQRLNVALTRAKYCLIVIGDVSSLGKANPMWKEFAENAQSRGLLTRLDSNLSEHAITQRIRSILRRTK